MNSPALLRFALGALVAGFTAQAATTPPAPAAAPVAAAKPMSEAAKLEFFEKRIRPVLASKCYECHSSEEKKAKGGLMLDTREGIREGGDSGHAVVPGNVKESLLVKALHWQQKDLRMPPEKQGGKLAEEVIADFEQWIAMGAPDPRVATVSAVKREIDWDEARKFWAFQAPRSVAAPAVKDVAWPRTEVDRFILATQEAQDLHPVPDASKPALLRRAYFDLVGLPPSPEEQAAFAADPSPEAFTKVVDRLLASPQFGERWGRHWLDVARFGESTGKERNYTFPTAWRYRDYVIDAMNADKPYDRFIREQIAGDLLPAKTEAERREHVVATGFLALGPKSLQEKVPEQFRVDQIDEQIDTTTRAVLGLTVACARCHDHKFDPVPQKDYYALSGIFRSTETLYGTQGAKMGVRNASSLINLSAPSAPTPPAAPTLTASEQQRLAELKKRNPKKAADILAMLLQRALDPPVTAKQAKKKKAGRFSEAPKPPPGADLCMGVREGRLSDSRLLVRGEVSQPSDAVPRGFVTVLQTEPGPALPGNASGRLELAEWLVSPSNPLTARVAVNRVWAHLFGQGLVRTADNFGKTGETPSHPELLDMLAVEFMKNGWSQKRLIRSLVLTRTYQLANSPDPAGVDRDPDNRLLWQASQRRLEAEAIRDAMLAASGDLDLARPKGSAVGHRGDAYLGKNVKPEVFTEFKAHYRSVYFPIVRDFAPEVLELFDFAEPSLVVAARDATNVPSQALYLMNNSFVREQSAALAKRVMAEEQETDARISVAYSLALGRAATASEQQRAQQYLEQTASALPGAAPELPWSTFCQALFASAEFRYLR